MRLLPVLALLCSGTAVAGDSYFTHQGRLLDPVGAPLESSHSITLHMYEAATGGTARWSQTTNAVAFSGGYFAVPVTGADDSGVDLDSVPYMITGPVWLAIAIDGGAEMSPRQRLASNTFAGITPVAPASTYNGSDADNAAVTCDTLLTEYPSTSSGPYWLDPDDDGGPIDPFYGYCEMNIEGGWTLVLRGGTGVPTKAQWNTTAVHNLAGASSGTQTGATFKLSDSVINAIGGVYRTNTDGLYTHTRYSPSTCVYSHNSTASGDCAKTCDEVGLSTCSEPGSTAYGLGLSGGVGLSGQGCGVQYFATQPNPGYQAGTGNNYNMYWIVQTVGSSATNGSCRYGPGQRWLDNGNSNDDSHITVWRR